MQSYQALSETPLELLLSMLFKLCVYIVYTLCVLIRVCRGERLTLVPSSVVFSFYLLVCLFFYFLEPGSLTDPEDHQWLD